MSPLDRSSAYGSCTFKAIVCQPGLWPIGCREVAGSRRSLHCHNAAVQRSGRLVPTPFLRSPVSTVPTVKTNRVRMKTTTCENSPTALVVLRRL